MASQHRFERTRRVVDDALSARVAPCASVEVGRAAGPLWRYAAGRLTYAPDAAAADERTIFDLASLTKVLSTAPITMRLLREHAVSLETRAADVLGCWRGADRAAVTIRDLLEHCSGLPASRQYFRDRSGRGAFEAAICEEPLVYAPRTASIYSDPGFMLLGFMLENAAGAALDTGFRNWRDAAIGDEDIAFLPPATWHARIAPTEDDPWRGRLLVGEVHDENAAALGGVAAHAGLFGTAGATGACARWWLARLNGGDDPRTGLSAAEAQRFAARSTVPGSSRALAWDTMLPTSSCGTRMSPRAIGHTGFTGTSLWIDPAQDLYAVLLTNRVHPSRLTDLIQPVRRAFHDAVVDDLQEQP